MALSLLLVCVIVALAANGRGNNTKGGAAQDSLPALRKFVVADIETHVPLRNAIVFTDDYIDTTNYRGVCYVPTTFDTLTVYRHAYLAERLLPGEAGDSTFLIPEGKSIGEVTVWGSDGRKRINDAIEAAKRAHGPHLPDGKTGRLLTFDLGKMLDKQTRRDHNHLRKIREKFKEADESADPIEAAYEQTVLDNTWGEVGDSLEQVYQAKGDSLRRIQAARRDSITRTVARQAEAVATQKGKTK